jgi:hypothetical protein
MHGTWYPLRFLPDMAIYSALGTVRDKKPERPVPTRFYLYHSSEGKRGGSEFAKVDRKMDFGWLRED